MQWRIGFLELQSNDFGHGIYNQTSEYFSILYSQEVLNQVTDTTTDTTTDNSAFAGSTLSLDITATWTSVPLPYTPQAKSLTLGYSASADNLVADAGETADHRLLHDHPAGFRRAKPDSTGVSFIT